MPGSPVHLFLRFFDVLTSPPLTEVEHRQVEQVLKPAELSLFRSQQTADQRHGYEGARSLIEREVDDPIMLRAVLLHDVGKRHSALGVWGRSLASILMALRLPLSARMASYRDHGPIGARELEEAGSEPLVVDFAAHHQGDRPDSVDEKTWALLLEADAPPKAKTMVHRGISWPGA